jgi:dipeptidyl aminopeptidase/acylaminoacyl peptidase
MERDLRHTALYHEIEEHFRRAYAPAFGRISGVADLAPSPDGQRVAFTGSKWELLEGRPTTRICIADMATGAVEEVTAGPNSDRYPQWSPDGRRLAFLSDRVEKGRHQLYLLESDRIGEAVATPTVEGTVEYIEWAPDGRAILLGVAGSGADLAGAQGSGTTAVKKEELPAWMPEIDTGVAENQWRRIWRYDVTTRTSQVIAREGLNVWEAVWAGPDRLAAITSHDPGEGSWYTAPLTLIDAASGQEEILYESRQQLGLPAASPSGRRLAIVQAVCSDRGVVAGDLLVFDTKGTAPGTPIAVDTLGTDVTHLAWRDENRLFFAGVRGLRSVYGEYDATTSQVRELWVTDETSGLRYPDAVPLDDNAGAFVLALQSYTRYPEVAIVQEGTPQIVTRLAHEGSDYLREIGGRLEEAHWTAPDGLEIDGLLVLPTGPGPYPLIVHVHGGPVWSYRNTWSMYYSLTPLLVSRGYAVLHPNPRGSAGRGQAFAGLVYGDMGGADTQDILSGVEALVERGIADTTRVGVVGGSYGGYMSSWLVTQTNRFAAAVPISPVTDWVSQHYTSNIGFFDQIFLQDDPANAAGRFSTRSPITYADRVRTPTLQTAGARDRCTPPGQAEEFHRALLEHGVTSELAIYPEEGHGVGTFPAIIDYCTRVAGWFERFMPAR